MDFAGSPRPAACKHAEPFHEACLASLQPRLDPDPPQTSQDTCVRTLNIWWEMQILSLLRTPKFPEDGPGTLQLGDSPRVSTPLPGSQSCCMAAPSPMIGARSRLSECCGFLPPPVWTPSECPLTSCPCPVACRAVLFPRECPPGPPGPGAYTVKPFLRLSS